MSRKNWNKKKILAAAGVGGGVLLAALAIVWSSQDNHAQAADKEEQQVTLAIAGEDQDLVSSTAEEGDDGLTLSVAEESTESPDTQAAAEEVSEAEPEGQEETAELTETEEPTEAPATEEAVTEEAATEEAATEEKKEEPVSYETLETTHTGSEGIIAMDVSAIVENCMPSIVSITQKSVQEIESYFYGKQELETEGAGSGIIIAQNDEELLIATNRHVVANSTEIHVCFTVDAEDPDDLIVPAVTKGTDSGYDLAVVAVSLKDIPDEVFRQLKIATLGSSKDLKVGETAIAIGNALGVGQTVTSGIISAVEREITTDVGTFTELQTDAAINFGCSGGALLNKRGEVIGINDAKATGNDAESMGYAIPIDAAKPVLTNLINRETRQTVKDHGVLGITVVSVSDEAKELYSMPMGAVVYEVSKDSAAEKAGLKKGDIITKFDGITISDKDELVETLEYYEVGETVTLEVQRASEGTYNAKEIEVTLQKNTEENTSSQNPEGETEASTEGEPNGQYFDDMPDFYGRFFDDGGNGGLF